MKQTKNIKLTLLRLFLVILILLTMGMIYHFSAENAEKSTETTQVVVDKVVDNVIPDFDEKPEEEQQSIRAEASHILRKMAHMLEFGLLGLWCLLLLLTWRGGLFIKWAAALGFTLLYAISDEAHQHFVDGRGPSPTDVLIDFSGALIFCTAGLILSLFLRKECRETHCTRYFLPALDGGRKLKIAVAADLHSSPYETPLQMIQAEHPDLILIPGDLMEDTQTEDEAASGFAFLRECTRIAPTYYSVGNHEIACYHKGNPWRHPTPVPLSDRARELIRQTGAILLDNESQMWEGLRICALSSGINGRENKPNAQALASFAGESGYRILLCHHPEYYVPYIKDTEIELTVCGHAHGGHWRWFGKGIYAPGQGLFPKFTAGIHDGRCIISRGLGNHTWIPRICNNPELVILCFGYEEQDTKNQG